MTSTPSYFTIPLALKIELQKDAWLLWTSALELNSFPPLFIFTSQ